MQDGRKENAHLHYEDIITIENIELNRPKRYTNENYIKTSLYAKLLVLLSSLLKLNYFFK